MPTAMGQPAILTRVLMLVREEWEKHGLFDMPREFSLSADDWDQLKACFGHLYPTLELHNFPRFVVETDYGQITVHPAASLQPGTFVAEKG